MQLSRHWGLEANVRNQAKTTHSARSLLCVATVLEVAKDDFKLAVATSFLALGQKYPKTEFIFIDVAETIFVISREEADALLFAYETGDFQPASVARAQRDDGLCTDSYHPTYEREASQGDGWRFKEGCPKCGERKVRGRIDGKCYYCKGTKRQMLRGNSVECEHCKGTQ